MLAAEIIYAVLRADFDDRVGPHPLPEAFNKRDGVYITYRKVSTENLDIVDGWTGHDFVRMQMMVVHEDIIQCERAAQQMRWLMNEQQLSECVCVGGYSDYDDETQLYYEMVDFMMWQNAC